MGYKQRREANLPVNLKLLRGPNPLPSDLLGIWRLLMGAARERQRIGLEMQRRRLVQSIVANDMQRKGIS